MSNQEKNNQIKTEKSINKKGRTFACIMQIVLSFLDMIHNVHFIYYSSTIESNNISKFQFTLYN